MTHICAILLAGGIGSRMGTETPKQFLPFGEKPIALHSYEILCSSNRIDEIIVVVEKEYQFFFEEEIIPLKFALPGKRRQDSVFSGMVAASDHAEYFCVHDSARPLITHEMIKRVCDQAIAKGAATLGTKLKFTVKEADTDGSVKKTLDRGSLWEIQTPQVVKRKLLEEGFQLIQQKKMTVTDDVSIAELVGAPVQLVEGSYQNIKITTPEDLKLAQQFLENEALPL